MRTNSVWGAWRGQLLERIDRIRRSLPAELQVRHLKALVTPDGQPAELEPVIGPGLVLDRLVRRNTGRNQHHAVKLEFTVGLLRADEVTKMWRIERTAENSHPHDASTASMAVALDQILEGAELAQADRASSVELLGRVADLGSHAELSPVGEASGSVHVHAGGVDAELEGRR